MIEHLPALFAAITALLSILTVRAQRAKIKSEVELTYSQLARQSTLFAQEQVKALTQRIDELETELELRTTESNQLRLTIQAMQHDREKDRLALEAATERIRKLEDDLENLRLINQSQARIIADRERTIAQLRGKGNP